MLSRNPLSVLALVAFVTLATGSEESSSTSSTYDDDWQRQMDEISHEEDLGWNRICCMDAYREGGLDFAWASCNECSELEACLDKCAAHQDPTHIDSCADRCGEY